MADITGTPGNDVLVGTTGNDKIKGRGGDDTITGLGGKDTLLGGAGNDIIDGGAGSDILKGGAGDDTLTGGLGKDTFNIESGYGNDTITDFGSADIINIIDPVIIDHASFLAALVDDGSGNSVLTLTDGSTMTFIGYTVADFASSQTSFAPIPCFAAGMLIQTPVGLRKIEDICAGDTVTTLGHGPKPVRWVGRAKVRFCAAPHHLKPVMLKAGALAPCVPDIDLIVSPQHRILICDWRAEFLFGESEVLVPAKGLINGRDIVRLDDCRAVEFVHILFDQHEIVTVNGVDAESLYPGAYSMAGLGAHAETEILELFPDLRATIDIAKWPLVKTEITVREARLLSAYNVAQSATVADLQHRTPTVISADQPNLPMPAATARVSPIQPNTSRRRLKTARGTAARLQVFAHHHLGGSQPQCTRNFLEHLIKSGKQSGVKRLSFGGL